MEARRAAYVFYMSLLTFAKGTLGGTILLFAFQKTADILTNRSFRSCTNIMSILQDHLLVEGYPLTSYG